MSVSVNLRESAQLDKNETQPKHTTMAMSETAVLPPIEYTSCMREDFLQSSRPAAVRSCKTVQIMMGLLTLGLGAVLLRIYFGPYYMRDICPPYWLGPIFVVSGILCLFAERFPSPFLVSMTVAVNLLSSALAVAAIALYAFDDGPRMADVCVTYDPSDRYDSEDGYGVRRMANLTAEARGRRERNFQLCRVYRGAALPIVFGLKGLLVACAALQLCVNISTAVLAIKALKKNSEGEVPEVQQPLMEEVTANPVA